MDTQNFKRKTCAITGRRPDGFPWKYGESPLYAQYRERLKKVLLRLIHEEGITRFITGGALGIDMDVAEILLDLQAAYPFLSHLLALPYKNQGGRYAANDKIRHERLQLLSPTVVLSEDYTPWCMQVRNEYMVDEADLLIAFTAGEKKGGTFNTLRYAKKKNKPVFEFRLETCLSLTADEWYDLSRPVEQLKLI